MTDPRTILIIGNIIDGIHIVGPFLDSDDAVDYSERFCKSDDYIVHTIHKPFKRNDSQPLTGKLTRWHD